MRGVQARVDHLNDESLPLLDCLIGARHPRWIGDLGAIAPQEFRIHDRLARALRERGRNTAHALDGLEGGPGCLEREALEHVVVVPHVLDGRPRRRSSYRLPEALSHSLEIRSAIFELNDERLLRVVRSVGTLRHLAVIYIDRVRGRDTHGRDGQGTGRDERQCRHFAVGHVWFPFLTTALWGRTLPRRSIPLRVTESRPGRDSYLEFLSSLSNCHSLNLSDKLIT